MNKKLKSIKLLVMLETLLIDETDKKLLECKYSIANKLNVNIYSWVYYNRNDELCILSNDKGNFSINQRSSQDIKSKLTPQVTNVTVDTYLLRLVSKRVSIRLYKNEIKNELEYIKKSDILYDKSKDLIEYISSQIGSYSMCNLFETVWFFKNYLRITIDMHKFIIKIHDLNNNKEIIACPKKLKEFLTLNKSKILKIVKNNIKLHKVKMDNNKRVQFNIELKLKETEELEKDDLSHDATRKVGSKVKEPQIYIKKTLKERYEIQSQKLYPTKYSWDN